MNTINFDNVSEFPLTTDALAFMQTAFGNLERLGALGGANYIVSGCADLGGNNIEAGWMFLKGGMSEGKLMRFEGGPINEKRNVVIDRQEVSKPVGGYHRIETTYTAKFGFDSEEAALNIAWDDVKGIEKLASLTTLVNSHADIISQNIAEIEKKADKANVLTLDGDNTFTPSEDQHPAIYKNIKDLAGEVKWEEVANTADELKSDKTTVKACKIGKVIYVTGHLELTGIPKEDSVIFTLSDKFPEFTETHYFSAGDANSDENYELKALGSSRTIVMGGGGSTESVAYFTVPIVIL